MDRSQRWRERREAYVPNASEINPADYTVAAIGERQARAFVIEHHYSGTFPAARLSAGLFRGRELVGVAVFSVPMNNAAIPKYTGLEDPLAGVDLGRLVLLDDVPGNGETFFLARAFRELRREKPGVLAVMSCADPAPRVIGGQVIKPGHVGMIYQGMSAAHRGRTKARLEYLTPDGQTFSERAFYKIKLRESGVAYAVDELVRRGAPRPANDDLPAWLAGLVAGGFLARRKHPGNFVYSFALTQAAKIAAKGLPTLPYPRLAA